MCTRYAQAHAVCLLPFDGVGGRLVEPICMAGGDVDGELFKDTQTGHQYISAKLVYYLIMPPREWALRKKVS
jgi:hypothetical protein